MNKYTVVNGNTAEVCEFDSHHYNNNMKFTYTHITKNYTEITEYIVIKDKVITNKIRQKSDNINIK